MAKCHEPLSDCGGVCSDSNTDLRNCGACGHACGTTETCVDGTCLPACGTGTARCGSICASLDHDPSHCGACGNACPIGADCVDGTCECPAEAPLACGGKCIGLDDPNDCGACGNVCATGKCVGGTCLKAVEVVRGDGVACAKVLPGPEIRCWGDGALGIAKKDAVKDGTPLPVTLSTLGGIGDLSIGSPGCSACVVGGSAIECWADPTEKDVHVGRCPGWERPRWVEFGQRISAGKSHFCVVDAGKVRCTGSNTLGQSAFPKSSSVTRAEVTLPEPVAGVAALGDASCAWTPAGVAYCWGEFIGGTSDVADTMSGAVRKLDLLPPVREVLPQLGVPSRMCAIATDASLWCWNRVSPPTKVATTVSDASAVGPYFNQQTCWFAAGKVSCTVPGESIEIPLPPTTKRVSLHGRQGCALLEDGNVLCWGSNRYHELGKGAPSTVSDWNTPYRIVW